MGGSPVSCFFKFKIQNRISAMSVHYFKPSVHKHMARKSNSSLKDTHWRLKENKAVGAKQARQRMEVK